MENNRNDHYPHDGKHGRCGCGQGYSWDDNYDYQGRKNGGGNGCGGLAILIIVVSIISAFNDVLAALIVIVVGFFLIMNH